MDFAELLPETLKSTAVPIVLYKSGDDDIVIDTKKNEKKITNSQVWL